MTYMNWKMNNDSKKNNLYSEGSFFDGRRHSIDLPAGADIEIVQSFAPISHYDNYEYSDY